MVEIMDSVPICSMYGIVSCIYPKNGLVLSAHIPALWSIWDMDSVVNRHPLVNTDNFGKIHNVINGKTQYFHGHVP